jgi:5-methylcytosine-specific restriction endonuclease McrBC regulatory subunit McrC
MARKRYSAEQIIGYLREAEVLLASGSTIGQVFMSYYQNVLAWCRLLLNGHGPTPSTGDFNTLSLPYPM